MTNHLSPTPRRVKHRLGASILFAVLTAAATAIGMCGVAAAEDPPPEVTYQLSGSAPMADLITYQTDTGQAILAHVPLPWQTQFKSFGPEVFVLSAQSPGSVTCTILLDGNVVSQATANGAPARTVCSH
jgi:hypothetical protein